MADSKRARSWKRRTLPRIDLINAEPVLYSTSASCPRQFLNPGEILPRLPTVLAPVKMNRFGADINDFLIYRIDGDGPDVAFENSAPTPARIVGSVKPILGDAEKTTLGWPLRPSTESMVPLSNATEILSQEPFFERQTNKPSCVPA